MCCGHLKKQWGFLVGLTSSSDNIRWHPPLPSDRLGSNYQMQGGKRMATISVLICGPKGQ